MFSYYVGMMSGTSLDAVDGVLVCFEDDTEQLTRIAACSLPLPTELRQLLTHLAHATQLTFKDLATAEDGITRCYAQCTNQLLKDIDAHQQPLALGCHGQTIEHQPNSTPPYTLQLLNPSLLAELTGQNVICDFRRRDLAAGGQAAPLVPAFHQAALQSKDGDRIVINLGGIANLTYLPADKNKKVIGFDTGPANLLLDAWYQQHWHSDYDPSGQRASGGCVIPELLQQLCSDEYFSRLPPKSTGREYFNPQWLNSQLATYKQQNLLPEDVLATLTELTAATLVEQIKHLDPTSQAQLMICGGGWFNRFLVSRICALSSPRKVTSTDEAGIPPQEMEAIAFAWLAKQHVNRQQGNLPSVTGARGGRVLGGFYPA